MSSQSMSELPSTQEAGSQALLASKLLHATAHLPHVEETAQESAASRRLAPPSPESSCYPAYCQDVEDDNVALTNAQQALSTIFLPTRTCGEEPKNAAGLNADVDDDETHDGNVEDPACEQHAPATGTTQDAQDGVRRKARAEACAPSLSEGSLSRGMTHHNHAAILQVLDIQAIQAQAIKVTISDGSTKIRALIGPQKYPEFCALDLKKFEVVQITLQQAHTSVVDSIRAMEPRVRWHAVIGNPQFEQPKSQSSLGTPTMQSSAVDAECRKNTASQIENDTNDEACAEQETSARNTGCTKRELCLDRFSNSGKSLAEPATTFLRSRARHSPVKLEDVCPDALPCKSTSAVETRRAAAMRQQNEQRRTEAFLEAAEEGGDESQFTQVESQYPVEEGREEGSHGIVELAREELCVEHEKRELRGMRKISKVEEELVPSQSVAQESVAHLQAENEELREKLNQKEKKCKEFEVQVLLLKTKEEDASKEAKELRANLREARANSAFLAKQLEETKLQLENATLHAARMLSEEEIKKTDTYKAFVETARTSSKKMLQHKDEELQKLKDDNTNKDAEIEALRTEVEKLNETLSEAWQAKEVADQAANDARATAEKLDANLKSASQKQLEDAENNNAKLNELKSQIYEWRCKALQAEQTLAASATVASAPIASTRTQTSANASVGDGHAIASNASALPETDDSAPQAVVAVTEPLQCSSSKDGTSFPASPFSQGQGFEREKASGQRRKMVARDLSSQALGSASLTRPRSTSVKTQRQKKAGPKTGPKETGVCPPERKDGEVEQREDEIPSVFMSPGSRAVVTGMLSLKCLQTSPQEASESQAVAHTLTTLRRNTAVEEEEEAIAAMKRKEEEAMKRAGAKKDIEDDCKRSPDAASLGSAVYCHSPEHDTDNTQHCSAPIHADDAEDAENLLYSDIFARAKSHAIAQEPSFSISPSSSAVCTGAAGGKAKGGRLKRKGQAEETDASVLSVENVASAVVKRRQQLSAGRAEEQERRRGVDAKAGASGVQNSGLASMKRKEEETIAAMKRKEEKVQADGVKMAAGKSVKQKATEGGEVKEDMTEESREATKRRQQDGTKAHKCIQTPTTVQRRLAKCSAPDNSVAGSSRDVDDDALSPRRSAKRQRVATSVQRRKILFVGFDKPEEISARDKVFVPWLEANNAQVTPDPKECTHLVLTRVKTSSKFLSVIARGGVPLLSSSWIQESIKHNGWVEESPYWLQDVEGEGKLGVKLAELNARGQSGAGSGGRPLKGLTFFRHQSFPMKPDETKCLIECAGGTLKSKPANGTTRILADAPPTDKSLRAYKVHNLDWLKNTVLRNEVSD